MACLLYTSFNAAGEVVERHNRRDRDQQSERRGHQGFGNTTGDRADTSRLRSRDGAERVHDAEHCTEQTDERARGTDGGQAAYAALQFCVHNLSLIHI